MSKKVSPLLVRLVVLFTSCLIISNILANRMVQVGHWSMDAGNLLFPVTYILSDVFSEVYGYKWSRRVTWWAASMNLLFACLVSLVNVLPAPEYFEPLHFKLALGSSFRIVIASLVSYVVGDLVNDRVFRRMKCGRNGMKGFAGRAIVSSIFGQIVDSALFVSIAFYGTMSTGELIGMMGLNIVVKVAYEIIVLPATYKVTTLIYEKENNLGGFINEQD